MLSPSKLGSRAIRLWRGIGISQDDAHGVSPFFATAERVLGRALSQLAGISLRFETIHAARLGARTARWGECLVETGCLGALEPSCAMDRDSYRELGEPRQPYRGRGEKPPPSVALSFASPGQPIESALSLFRPLAAREIQARSRKDTNVERSRGLLCERVGCFRPTRSDTITYAKWNPPAVVHRLLQSDVGDVKTFRFLCGLACVARLSDIFD